MSKIFLNVKYSETITRINVTDFVDLSEVRRAIKAKFPNSLAHIDAPQLQLYTANGDLINTSDVFKSLPGEYFTEGGLCVVIQTKAVDEIASLVSDFSCLRLEVKPKAASSFSARNIGSDSMVNAAVNGIFSTVNLPAIVRDAITCRVNEEDLVLPMETVQDGLFFTMFCNNVSELSMGVGRSVDAKLFDLYSKFFRSNYESNASTEKVTLETLNASFGLSTQISKPDFIHTTTLKDGSRFGLALFEFKDTAQAPLEQMGQAYTSGSNIISSHIRLGLKWSECAVPLVLTNGNLYQFAWVTSLKPSLPVLHVATGVLDASIPSNRKLIAKHLVQIREFCSRIEAKIKTISTKPNFDENFSFALDRVIYYRKRVDDVFLRWPKEPEDSLGYLWQVYEKLADVEEAVLPLGFAMLKPFHSKSEKCIIFPKLGEEFSMGVPSDKDLHLKYLQELSAVINKIHQAGVIHADLYPSNILWCYRDNQMNIRIIDWDAATLLGHSFTPTMEERLASDKYSVYYWKRKGQVEPKFDYWFLYILSNLTDDERESMNGTDPSTVNMKFIESFARQRGGGVDLDQAFEDWYDLNFANI